MNKGLFTVAISMVLVFASMACATGRHETASTRSICTKCYDELVRVKSANPRVPDGTIVKHACPDCSADVAVYTEKGTLAIKCPKCAPDGVACDECKPAH